MTPPVEQTNRHTIDVEDWDLRDTASLVLDQICARLSPSEPDLLRRGGSLVRVERDDDGQGVVRRLRTAHMALIISDNITVRKGKKAAPPPKALSDAVAAEAIADMRIPALRGVVRHPFLARKANHKGYEVVWETGYHPPSGMWLDCDVQLNSSMSLEEAKRVWWDLMGEFPYAEPYDEKALLAAALSSICKPACGLIPIIVVHKPTVGTGATLAARTIARILTGQDPTMLTPAGGRSADAEGEMRKRLFSLLRAGRQFVVLDNFDSLQSDVLASVITAGVVEERVMGVMDVERVEVAAVIWATGNNLLTSPDIASRALPIRLDAKMPDPSMRREFRYDPILETVSRYRDHWLSALLAMVSRWCEAGCPPAPETWVRSRFSGWHETVPAIIAFLYGFEMENDPLKGHRRFADASQLSNWNAFIARLLEMDKPSTHSWTTSDFIPILEDMDDPPWDSSRTTSERGKRTSLGRVLRRIEGQRWAMGDGITYTLLAIKKPNGTVCYRLADVDELLPYEDKRFDPHLF